MVRTYLLLVLLLLTGCETVATFGAEIPTSIELAGCLGFEDAAIREVYDQIDAAWDDDVSRAEVLAVGFASGCSAECFDCWQAVTDYVYFEVH